MLEEKVVEVERVFAELDAEISAFQGWSGLHCLHGCGKCCFKPDIEATVLEFLPFAFHLYRKGEVDRWLEKLERQSSEICVILDPARQEQACVLSTLIAGLSVDCLAILLERINTIKKNW